MPNQSNPIPAVVSVVGQDQKGVVAKVSTYLANQNVNILDIEQKVVQGWFIMNMLVDLADLDIQLDELFRDLNRVGQDINMDIEVRLLGRKKTKRMVIMVSKEPHCLVRLMEDIKEETITAEVAAVISNHEELRGMAEAAGLPFECIVHEDRTKRDELMVARLQELNPDLIVLARYMQILPKFFIDAFPNRMINIHPSLLPYHKGANAYRQAFEKGNRVAGCTAHFVTEDLDEGPIILQDVFHISVGSDTLEDVKRKGQELEANVLSKATQLFLNNELLVKDGKVVYKPGNDFFKKHHTL
ncbi:MAG: ACT domain-containing protein [Candidatus Sumerlaeia bacterium]|nr:ACT domain-containing protein [Candidatus Sumerlaeia bacterium]